MIRAFADFNRYMVECELGRFSIEVPADIHFNRYMVECEYLQVLNTIYDDGNFNRYMVECEFAIFALMIKKGVEF